jgi:Galactose oxidase, central domain
MNTWFWEKIQIKGSNLPTSREGHSFLYVSSMLTWVLFGGVGTGRSNETLCLDTISQEWKPINKFKAPLERAYHITWIDEDSKRMYIFGGQGSKREPIYDMHSLYIPTGKWVKLGPLERPAARIHSAGCLLSSCLFLFGGASAPSDVPNNDLWSFPYTEINWEIAEKEGYCPGWVKHETLCTPEKRKGHTMVTDKTSIFIFGGLNKTIYLNDLYCIKPPDSSWYLPHTFGQKPSPRAFHSSTVTSNLKMIIFGGKGPSVNNSNEILCDVFILDLKDLHWSSPFIGGFYPSNRYGAGMAWGKNINSREQILIIGGIGKNYPGMDLYSLEEKVIESDTQWHLQDIQTGILKYQVRAESTLLSNRRKIRDLEGQIYMLQEKNSYIEDDILTLQGKIEIQNYQISENKEFFNKVSYDLKTEIRSNKKNISKYIRMSKLKQIKLKNLEDRVSRLGSMLKDIEGFVVTMDSLFYNTISLNIDNDIQTFSEEKLEEISERKKSHQEALIELRDWYEKNIKLEQSIDC